MTLDPIGAPAGRGYQSCGGLGVSAWLRKDMAKSLTVLVGVAAQINYKVGTIVLHQPLANTRAKLTTAKGVSSLKSDETRHGPRRLWSDAPQCWRSAR